MCIEGGIKRNEKNNPQFRVDSSWKRVEKGINKQKCKEILDEIRDYEYN